MLDPSLRLWKSQETDSSSSTRASAQNADMCHLCQIRQCPAHFPRAYFSQQAAAIKSSEPGCTTVASHEVMIDVRTFIRSRMEGPGSSDPMPNT